MLTPDWIQIIEKQTPQAPILASQQPPQEQEEEIIDPLQREEETKPKKEIIKNIGKQEVEEEITPNPEEISKKKQKKNKKDIRISRNNLLSEEEQEEIEKGDILPDYNEATQKNSPQIAVPVIPLARNSKYPLLYELFEIFTRDFWRNYLKFGDYRIMQSVVIHFFLFKISFNRHRRII